MEEKGLYSKYTVTKNSTGEVVKDCFVLRPDRDPHARAALEAYADNCERDNPTLAEEIRLWLFSVDSQDKE